MKMHIVTEQTFTNVCILIKA